MKVYISLFCFQAQCKATGAVYIVAETLLSQLPVQKGKAQMSNGDTPKIEAGNKSNNSKEDASSGKKGNSKTDKSSEKKSDTSGYTILARMKGLDLAGKRYMPYIAAISLGGSCSLFVTPLTFFCRYEPLFEYFLELSGVAFKVLADEYVTDDSGTGVVHCAPAFGEDDFRVCLQAGIIDTVRHFFIRSSLLPSYCVI